MYYKFYRNLRETRLKDKVLLYEDEFTANLWIPVIFVD